MSTKVVVFNDPLNLTVGGGSKVSDTVMDTFNLYTNQTYTYSLSDSTSPYSTSTIHIGGYDDLCKSIGRVNDNGVCLSAAS
jgi:hypothetical protein